eukprot:CAMPEP_0179911000 /NCGR_PEP_ID=MMETSP0982-20121206/46088_1 /TAXON_ID=483367 /ORGANISM="non described non described, Strain CCMP 2436" /LENGTH=46 /DNA_ID= /DNA_START= /DNA_END= /DNA_ORIENTATION=
MAACENGHGLLGFEREERERLGEWYTSDGARDWAARVAGLGERVRV